MISNSKILITGGYGFIGAHLALLLADSDLGNEVTVFDKNIGSQTTGDDLRLSGLSNVIVLEGSVLDESDITSLSKDFDYIIHAAGFLGIGAVAEQQLATMDVNIQGTRNCLELAIKQKKRPHVLVFSTSEIYGSESGEQDEAEVSVIPTVGKRWSYAASKLAAEYYLKAYIQKHNIRGSIIRPFNVFGPFRYGSNAMTTIVEKAIKNRQITISGDGNQVRSWCYVDDFCEGVIAVMEDSKGVGEAYNIGDPRNIYSMKALAKKIVDITNSSSRISISFNKTEDILLRIPNIQKAKNQLSYEPSGDFDENIAKVANWLSKISDKTMASETVK